jgi:CRP/FNR family transcriptional regulator, cyclic AMP receptor protein
MLHRPRIDLLQAMPIFGALRDDTLEFLLALMQEVHVSAGGWFFGEGDAASGLFVLEAGSASVLKGWAGHEVLLRHLQAGDCFGEMALMDLQPRSASVRADADCLAIALGADDLLRLWAHDLEQFALIQMNMGREVSRRLREADDELFRLRQAGAAPPHVAAGYSP